MKISRKGLALIKAYEGVRLTAYLCPAQVWTVGYGSTGPHVYRGLKITMPDAEKLLLDDLARFESAVNKHAKSPTQNQFDAMVSLAFNIGIAGLQKSSVLRHHNMGAFVSAANCFGLWNKAGGKVLKGLVNRRADDAALYRGLS